jgi:hypothetical protein
MNDNMYTITNNPLEIISGTTNTTAPIYTEAANIINKDQNKAMSYIKKFLESIQKVRVKDDRISKTKGNISLFYKYNDLNESLSHLGKHVPNNAEFKALKTIKSVLEKNKSYYTEAYDRNIDILIMEYESAMYLLIEGIGFVITSYIAVKFNGTKTVMTPKTNSINKGIITKLVIDLAKEISNKEHDNYVKELVEFKDNNKGVTPVTEAAGDIVVETIRLFVSAIKNSSTFIKMGKHAIQIFIKSIFGIVPLIRSIIYLHYKRKAKLINSLETQAQFIQLNIDMLRNRTNIDATKKEEIIKKQEAVVDAYIKRAEKLRAELVEAEKDAATALAEDNKTTISKPSNDDDFILD